MGENGSLPDPGDPGRAHSPARRSSDEPHLAVTEAALVSTTSENPGTLPGEVERLEAQALVREARIAALTHEIEQLHKAMDSRAAIEQAKGVLMATMRIGPDDAFDVLVAASQRENRKLREIAERLVASQPCTQAGLSHRDAKSAGRRPRKDPTDSAGC